MGLFDGLPVPKWESPTELDLAAAKAGESFAHNFSQAFLQARQHKYNMEEKALPMGRGDLPSAAWEQEPMSGEGAQWMSPATDRYKFSSPTEALAKIYNADSIQEASEIVQANSDWLSNPTFRTVVGKAMDNVGEKQRLMQQAEAAKASATARDMALRSKTGFAQTLDEITKVDVAEGMRLAKLPVDPQTGLPTPEAAAEITATQKRFRDAGLLEKERHAQSPLGKLQADYHAALERGDQAEADMLQQQMVEAKDLKPSTFSEKTASGKLMEGLYNKQTGHYSIAKTVMDPKDKVMLDALSKEIVTLKGKLITTVSPTTQAKYQKQLDSLQKEFDALGQPKSNEQPAAPVPVGRFLMTVPPK